MPRTARIRRIEATQDREEARAHRGQPVIKDIRDMDDPVNVMIVSFYENIYNKRRKKNIKVRGSGGYRELYNDLMKYLQVMKKLGYDISAAQEVVEPDKFLKPDIFYEDRPLLDHAKGRFMEGGWDNKRQEKFFEKTTGVTASLGYKILIGAEMATNLLYILIPWQGQILNALGVSDPTGLIGGTWTAAGISSMGFNIFSGFYVPKTFIRNISNFKYIKSVGNLHKKYMEIFRSRNKIRQQQEIEPVNYLQLLKERKIKEMVKSYWERRRKEKELPTYREIFEGRKNEFDRLATKLNEELETIQEETSSKLAVLDLIKDRYEAAEVYKEKGGMDACTRSIDETEYLRSFESSWIKRIMMAVKGNPAALAPFDTEKTQTFARAIRKSWKALGKDYKSLLHMLGHGSNPKAPWWRKIRPRIVTNWADVITTGMFTTLVLPKMFSFISSKTLPVIANKFHSAAPFINSKLIPLSASVATHFSSIINNAPHIVQSILNTGSNWSFKITVGVVVLAGYHIWNQEAGLRIPLAPFKEPKSGKEKVSRKSKRALIKSLSLSSERFYGRSRYKGKMMAALDKLVEFYVMDEIDRLNGINVNRLDYAIEEELKAKEEQGLAEVKNGTGTKATLKGIREERSLQETLDFGEGQIPQEPIITGGAVQDSQEAIGQVSQEPTIPETVGQESPAVIITPEVAGQTPTTQEVVGQEKSDGTMSDVVEGAAQHRGGSKAAGKTNSTRRRPPAESGSSRGGNGRGTPAA